MQLCVGLRNKWITLEAFGREDTNIDKSDRPGRLADPAAEIDTEIDVQTVRTDTMTDHESIPEGVRGRLKNIDTQLSILTAEYAKDRTVIEENEKLIEACREHIKTASDRNEIRNLELNRLETERDIINAVVSSYASMRLATQFVSEVEDQETIPESKTVSTIRNESILKLLETSNGPLTRSQIADMLKINSKDVVSIYLSALKKNGYVSNNYRGEWRLTPDGKMLQQRQNSLGS